MKKQITVALLSVFTLSACIDEGTFGTPGSDADKELKSLSGSIHDINLSNSASVLEDSNGIISNFAEEMSAGYGEVVFEYSPLNALSSPPSMDQSGNISLPLASNFHGEIELTASLAQAPSIKTNSTITVIAVNDRPGFLIDGNIRATKNSGNNNYNGFASAFNLGHLEDTQENLQFVITNDNPDLFTSQPTVSTNGSLSFEPLSTAPNGIANITIALQDNGGTENNGVDTSETKAFTITIADPSPADINSQGDKTYLEDFGPVVIENMFSFDSAQHYSEFTFQINSTVGFATQPTVNPDGSLTFETAADSHGEFTVTYFLNSNPTDQLIDTITIEPVNDKPSITSTGNVLVESGSGLATLNNHFQLVDHGPSNESSQAFSEYLVSVENPSLFTVVPTVSPDGTLIFDFNDNLDTATQIMVRYRDNGGTDFGGKDLSDPITIELTSERTPTASAIVKGPTPSTVEDAGEVIIPDVFTIPSHIAVSDLTYSVNTSLTLIKPLTINIDGSVNFEVANDENGNIEIEYYVTSEPSDVQTTNIAVLPVNDAPSFSMTAELIKEPGSTIHTEASFATITSNGPSNESGQTALNFTVTVEDESHYSQLPVISNTGDLSFAFETSFIGETSIEVIYYDDGGTLNSGIDFSPSQTAILKSIPTVKNFSVSTTAIPKQLHLTWDYTGPGEHIELLKQTDDGSAFYKVDVNKDGVTDNLDNIAVNANTAKILVPGFIKDDLDSSIYKLNIIKDGLSFLQSDELDLTSIDYMELQARYQEPNNTNRESIYGSSVAISPDGEWMFIGASDSKIDSTTDYNVTSSSNNGAVFVYKRTIEDGYQYHSFLKSSRYSNNGHLYFGSTLAMHPNKDIIAVGTKGGLECYTGTQINPIITGSICNSGGMVELYKRSGSNWVFLKLIKPVVGGTNTGFGEEDMKWSSDGKLLAVPSPGQDNAYSGVKNSNGGSGTMTNSGLVNLYNFDLTTESFTDSIYIGAEQSKALNAFGTDVEFDNQGNMYIAAQQSIANAYYPTIYKYDISSGTPVFTSSFPVTTMLNYSTNKEVAIAVDPSGINIAVSNGGYSGLRIFNASSWELVHHEILYLDASHSNTKFGSYITYSEDGKKLFANFEMGSVTPGLDSNTETATMRKGGIGYFEINNDGTASSIKLFGGNHNRLSYSECGKSFAFTRNNDTLVLACPGDRSVGSGINSGAWGGSQANGAAWLY